MSYSSNRVGRLREAMARRGITVFYMRNLSNIKWATGFDAVFDDEDAHALIITAERALLHTDSRYFHAATMAAEGSLIEVDGSSRPHADLLAAFLDEACSSGVAALQNEVVIGLESLITLGEYRHIEEVFSQLSLPFRFKETKAFGVGIRAVKDSEEVRRLRVAQSITDAAFAHIIDFIEPGLTERAVQVELEDFMIRHGAQGLAFSSIVAAGANGANPHAIPGDMILEPGQSLVLDFGARALGYCSDMTRTVFLGEPSDYLKKAYEALREANERVESFLRPGVTGAQAQDLAESILASAGFAGTMGHSLGHGVGIDIHEEPVLATRNDRPLQNGNVVTVEPGIYLANEFGMRLEDFGVISEVGFDVFTQSTHDMVII